MEYTSYSTGHNRGTPITQCQTQLLTTGNRCLWSNTCNESRNWKK